MSVHKFMCDDPSNVDQVNVIHVLHAAFLIVQQLSRGFAVLRAFESACTDVYIRARSIFHRETRERLCTIVQEIIREFEVEEGDDYVIDLDAATCSLRSLQDNSRLAIVKQQGLLMDWLVRGYVHVAKNNPDALSSLKTDFVNQFFASEPEEYPSADVIKILPYALLNFYEHSALKDIEIRKRWLSSIFEKNANLKFLVVKNEIVAMDILRYDSNAKVDGELPWDRKQFERANNLALFVYYQTLIANDDMRSGWQLEITNQKITVAQFSEAHRKGKNLILLSKYYFLKL